MWLAAVVTATPGQLMQVVRHEQLPQVSQGRWEDSYPLPGAASFAANGRGRISDLCILEPALGDDHLDHPVY